MRDNMFWLDDTDTVDGRNPAPVDMVYKYTIVYRVSYMSGGARFLPWTVLFSLSGQSVSLFFSGSAAGPSCHNSPWFLGVMTNRSTQTMRVCYKVKSLQITTLVGGFNPCEKYISEIGSFPQVGIKKKYLKPPPSTLSCLVFDPPPITNR